MVKDGLYLSKRPLALPQSLNVQNNYSLISMFEAWICSFWPLYFSFSQGTRWRRSLVIIPRVESEFFDLKTCVVLDRLELGGQFGGIRPEKSINLPLVKVSAGWQSPSYRWKISTTSATKGVAEGREGAVSSRFRIPSRGGEFPSRIRRLKPANSVRVAVKPETSRVQRRFSSLAGAFPRSSNSNFLNSVSGHLDEGEKGEKKEKKEEE